MRVHFQKEILNYHFRYSFSIKGGSHGFLKSTSPNLDICMVFKEERTIQFLQRYLQTYVSPEPYPHTLLVTPMSRKLSSCPLKLPRHRAGCTQSRQNWKQSFCLLSQEPFLEYSVAAVQTCLFKCMFVRVCTELGKGDHGLVAMPHCRKDLCGCVCVCVCTQKRVLRPSVSRPGFSPEACVPS